MTNQLTTKQMKMLILMGVITDYRHLESNEYNLEGIDILDADNIDIEDFVIDYVEDADSADFEILKAYGFVDSKYETTIYGKQYIKLFNEDCKFDDKKIINFNFIDKSELKLSLLKISESTILSWLLKLVPWLSKAQDLIGL